MSHTIIHRFTHPPIDEVSLEEFELFAVDRLRGQSSVQLTLTPTDGLGGEEGRRWVRLVLCVHCEDF